MMHSHAMLQNWGMSAFNVQIQSMASMWFTGSKVRLGRQQEQQKQTSLELAFFIPNFMPFSIWTLPEIHLNVNSQSELLSDTGLCAVLMDGLFNFCHSWCQTQTTADKSVSLAIAVQRLMLKFWDATTIRIIWFSLENWVTHCSLD